MANTLLTIDQITAKAEAVLHETPTFLNRMNTQFDGQFGRKGAQIGSSLRIRLPFEPEVVDGSVLNVQDFEETSVTMTMATRKHVPVKFTDEELTLDLNSFSEQVLEPAVKRLIAKVESDVLSNIYKDVYNQVDCIGSNAVFHKVAEAEETLMKELVPEGDLHFHMAPKTNTDLVDSLKGLQEPSMALRRQYMSGLITKGAGFTFHRSTHMPHHTSGTCAATTGYTVNGANQTGSTLTIQSGSNTFLKGDVITIAGVYRVHPESKQNTGELQKFVVTADSGSSATSLAISPAITTSGGKQNVTASPASGAAIVKQGGASATYDVNLAYHRNAFAFVTADLELPSGAVMEARRIKSGNISMALVRDYDVRTAEMITRLDVLYGYKTIRPQLACRVATNGG